MIHAVIMASGFSRRMGKNKLLLTYDGKTVIEHVITTLENSNINEVVVVAREEHVIKIGKDHHCTILKNDYAEEGISASIRIGCQYSKYADGIIFVPGDQPLLSIKTINKLIDAFYVFSGKIIIPCYGDIGGSPVVFPNKYINKLIELRGDKGGKQIIKQSLCDVVYIAIENKIENLDVDTLEDYHKLS